MREASPSRDSLLSPSDPAPPCCPTELAHQAISSSNSSISLELDRLSLSVSISWAQETIAAGKTPLPRSQGLGQAEEWKV